MSLNQSDFRMCGSKGKKGSGFVDRGVVVGGGVGDSSFLRGHL